MIEFLEMFMSPLSPGQQINSMFPQNVFADINHKDFPPPKNRDRN